jgi:hypothetical protein
VLSPLSSVSTQCSHSAFPALPCTDGVHEMGEFGKI